MPIRQHIQLSSIMGDRLEDFFCSFPNQKYNFEIAEFSVSYELKFHFDSGRIKTIIHRFFKEDTACIDLVLDKFLKMQFKYVNKELNFSVEKKKQEKNKTGDDNPIDEFVEPDGVNVQPVSPKLESQCQPELNAKIDYVDYCDLPTELGLAMESINTGDFNENDQNLADLNAFLQNSFENNPPASECKTILKLELYPEKREIHSITLHKFEQGGFFFLEIAIEPKPQFVQFHLENAVTFIKKKTATPLTETLIEILNNQKKRNKRGAKAARDIPKKCKVDPTLARDSSKKDFFQSYCPQKHYYP